MHESTVIKHGAAIRFDHRHFWGKTGELLCGVGDRASRDNEIGLDMLEVLIGNLETGGVQESGISKMARLDPAFQAFLPTEPSRAEGLVEQGLLA